ncbi:hypothetical protein KYK29_05125 [Shinella daejeonensis]|uniref:hypothetical protein n=1 Tax=Shinella daejeonensis TaxID=659017 RepID=UPI0020C7F3A8|nr:hypothetical protein [Shinella daejeonensis]MCP8894303.1 hypothetical protein [Shinella daejeonensis]
MAVTYPFDLLDGFPGWSTEFEPLMRQEHSRTAGGVTYVKDFGSPLWRASYVSRSLTPNDLDAWRARLDLMEGGLQQFRGRQLSRCYPIRYPRGSWPTSNGFNGVNAKINTINGNRKVVTVGGLGGGLVLLPGDLLKIRDNLHRVVAGGAATGAGVLSGLEVRPHLWPDTVVNDPVSLDHPYCLMTIVSGSIRSSADAATGRGVISFDAIESR